jgi:hypothetical protein
MASMEAQDWWGDEQEEREALADLRRRRRPVAVWTDDDLDLLPASVLDRPYVSDELAQGRYEFVRTDHEPARRRRTTPAEAPVRSIATDAPAARAAGAERRPSVVRTITLVTDDDVVVDEPRAAAEPATASPSRRAGRDRERRPRTSAIQRLQHRPDSIAMWAAILGFLLIILAILSSDASAATLAAGA